MNWYEFSPVESNFYMGMDIIKQKPVVTDRNPFAEGLVDMHRCVYLPSAYEKNTNRILPEHFGQVS